MNLTSEWIRTPATQAVMELLLVGGFQAYFVGGCVRNALLKVPVKDIDIATEAHPTKVMALAAEAGLHAVPTGIEHGTVTVISEGVAYEITTFRKDVETSGRHAVVHFADSLEEDARRRDFTMNALYADRLGLIHDPLNGLPDLLAHRVRFIEDPAQRIREDYLRILRFFRFHAWYGSASEGMDPEALAAIATHVDGLAHLSRERVGAEVLRLLEAHDPLQSVAAMKATGVLTAVLPGADVALLGPLLHLEDELEASTDVIRRLASLGGHGVAERLRLSKAESRLLELLSSEIGRMTPAVTLGYRHGEQIGRSVLMLRAAALGIPVAPHEEADLRMGAGAVFPVSASDLMPRYKGAALGKVLRSLEARWLASACSISREKLLEGVRD